MSSFLDSPESPKNLFQTFSRHSLIKKKNTTMSKIKINKYLLFFCIQKNLFTSYTQWNREPRGGWRCGQAPQTILDRYKQKIKEINENYKVMPNGFVKTAKTVELCKGGIISS